MVPLFALCLKGCGIAPLALASWKAWELLPAGVATL